MPFPASYTIGQVFTTPAGHNVRVDSLVPLVLTTTAQLPPPIPGTFFAAGAEEDLLQVMATVNLNTPPAHIAGQRHVIGTAPTGAWAGHAKHIAESTGSAWSFIIPWQGLEASTGTPATLYTFNGTDWIVGSSSTTTALADGTYGDIIVSNSGTRMTVGSGVTNSITNNITQNFLGGMEWYDGNGFVAMTGPSQYALFPNSIPIPRLGSEGRMWIDVNVTGTPFDSSSLELQLSFDDGSTWERTAANGTGIPCDGRMIEPGVQVLPLETLTQPADYLWFETTPVPTPTGLKYRWQTQGFYDVTSAGPIALRLHSKGWMPAGTTITIIGVHFK